MSTCTLGQGPFPYIEHPGPVIGYYTHGAIVPAWAVDLGLIRADEATVPVHPYRDAKA
ncbi:hypothetical protein QDA04_gp89 [Microbacterium phage Megan]|uniref:Uncharacterized protein n=1 Tax=Microbacterium phage Megan TaxID=2656551 RepID=A0A649VL26_9CAUD|nr:hypothetical protein QDA04_gp89 [Microbacterium phage Megan]QGJ92759.1 hypothetical protein PBI_MEGAN_89 [Microbacterium phage Megan]